MKTKLTRISKRTLALILTVLMMFSMMIIGTVTASAKTWYKDDVLYWDFTAIKGGANYRAGKDDQGGTCENTNDQWSYHASAGGKVIKATFTKTFTFSSGGFFKTEQGKSSDGTWAEVQYKAPSTGQNMVIVSADGKSFSWGTYKEPTTTTTLSSLPAKNLLSSTLLFNSDYDTKAQSAWLWSATTGTGYAYPLTDKGTVYRRYLSTHATRDSSTSQYAIPFNATHSGSSISDWTKRFTSDNNHVGSSATSGTLTDHNYYVKLGTSLNSSSYKSWTAFKHISDTFTVSNTSITLGSSVTLKHSNVTGTLTTTEIGGGVYTYGYVYKAPDGTYHRIGDEHCFDNSVSFTPTVEGTYSIYGYVSDPYKLETNISTVKTLTVNPAGYNVTISAGAGGSVSPSGDKTVGPNGLSVTAKPNTDYHFKDWTVSGGASVDSSTSSTTTLRATATGTLTANFEKDSPACSSVTLTQEPSGTVYKGTEYTFTANAVDAVDGATYHFYLDGRLVQNSSSNIYTHTFTDTSNHSIYVQVEKTGYASVKSNTLTFTPVDSQTSASKDVTYYIDLHDNKPTSTSNNPTIKFSSGTDYSLTKQGTSTVYSATVSTPYIYDAQNGDKDTAIADISATVSCNGCEYPVTIGKKAITTGEAWLESIGQIKKDKVTTSTTTSSKKTKNTKVIYLLKPTDLDYNSGWDNPYLYYDADGVTWDHSKKMTYIGENKYSQYVYACEVSKDATVGVFKTAEGSVSGTDEIKHRSVNADLSAHNGFYISSSDTSNDNNGNFGRTLNTYEFEEAFVYSHPSTITISSGNSTNISMTKNDDYTGASVTYSVPSAYSSIISVSGNTLTAKTTTTRKTATITGTVHSEYYSSISTWSSKTFDEKTFTISVTVEPEVISGSFKVMSYNSVSSKFSVENGTFADSNAISTVLTGSEATGNKDATLYNCGIITQSGNEYTVKYAENEAETGYNLLRLTVTVSASPSDGYGFDGWYVGGEKSSQYKNEGDAITVDGNNYILTYAEQTKWKVNIIYKYDLYDDSIMTRYDEDNAKNDVHKEYEVKDIEFVGNEITDGDYTEILIHNAPNLLNDYYEYHLVSAPQSDEEPDGYVVSTDNAQNTCTITANLKKTVRTYTVYLDGETHRGGLTYQAPFTIQSGEVKGFKNNQNLIWYDDNKEVATGTSYSFRVTGDMHITAKENTDGKTFSGTSIIAHRSFDVNTAMKQLVHNFYIADFYNDDLGSYVQFIGGGVLYFAMDKTKGTPTKAKGAVNENGEAIEGEIEKVVERVAKGNGRPGFCYSDDQSSITDEETNIVCRYLEYNDHKELFKYSDELQAYQYIYSAGILNDAQYSNYSLRVYSYFVYYDENEGEYTISVSDEYSDANMYEAGK